MKDGDAPAKSTVPTWRTPIGYNETPSNPDRPEPREIFVDAVAASVAQLTPAQLMERRYMRYQWKVRAK